MTSVPDKAEPPTNENEAIVADVDIPGPYPSERGDPTGEPLSSESAPTKATRDAGSLGNLTESASRSTTREDTGGLGSPIYDEDSTTEKS